MDPHETSSEMAQAGSRSSGAGVTVLKVLLALIVVPTAMLCMLSVFVIGVCSMHR
jgi:hypothetical protein